MKVSVIGCGYIGKIHLTWLSGLENIKILAIDKKERHETLNKDMFPPELQDEIAANELQKIEFTKQLKFGDVNIVCINTPFDDSLNKLDTSNLFSVVNEFLRLTTSEILIIRSTLDQEFASHLRDLSCDRIFVMPEFLREGSAIVDFHRQDTLILGGCLPSIPKDHILFRFPVWKNFKYSTYAEAVAFKLLSNMYHAAKITLANEWGRVLKSNGFSSLKFHDMLGAFPELNFSEYYTKPGSPFGGPCLPKDTREFVNNLSGNINVIPLISSIITSNEEHTKFLCSLIKLQLSKNKAWFPITEFKFATNDDRDSPYVKIKEMLSSEGYIIAENRYLAEDDFIILPNKKYSEFAGSNTIYIDELIN